jgi:uncharacterized membrane protein YeaQ/YmgE (transglycosylase-associated protein family)
MLGIDSIIALLIVGAIAGWAAGQIVRGYGFGLLGNIVVGIVGASSASGSWASSASMSAAASSRRP